MPRFLCLLQGSLAEFLSIPPNAVLGQLAAAHTLAPLEVDRHGPGKRRFRSWEPLMGFQGTVFLEFDVPRLGSRIDAILVSGPAVFPIEFKCGEQKFSQQAYNQAWDYALNFEELPSCPAFLDQRPFTV